ncbi:hypothetical protein AALP_AA6G336600 [Arabis alpina]|uniref:Uncharacterized protein n=1 Tax=Arabis alpina TaxID=50452 RepID=A0A087GTE1_ARAAL|nr:hypothetical protein AALP_AA6G336600 [Arabis alpina]
MTSVPGSFGLHSAFYWPFDLLGTAFMAYPDNKDNTEDKFGVIEPKRSVLVHEPEPNDGDPDAFDLKSSGYSDAPMSPLVRTEGPTSFERGNDPMSRFDFTEGLHIVNEGFVIVTDMRGVATRTTGPDDQNAEDSSGPDEPNARTPVVLAGLDTDVQSTEDPMGSVIDNSYDPNDLRFMDDESPNLPLGRADASSSSSPSDSHASSVEGGDEDIVDEVEQTKKAASTQRVNVRPDPPGSTVSKKKSLQRLREKCKTSEDIELVVPSSVDRADAPPPGYLTLFENYFDQCLLWFPLPGFLMRFLAAHSVYLALAQVNPRGIKHLIVKPSFPKVSKKFIEAMHKELSSGKAAKAARSSGTNAPRAVVPMTLTPTAPSVHARSSRPLAIKTPATSTLLLPPSLTPDKLAMRQKQSEKRARLSSGKGKGIDYGTSSKK